MLLCSRVRAIARHDVQQCTLQRAQAQQQMQLAAALMLVCSPQAPVPTRVPLGTSPQPSPRPSSLPQPQPQRCQQVHPQQRSRQRPQQQLAPQEMTFLQELPIVCRNAAYLLAAFSVLLPVFIMCNLYRSARARARAWLL